MSHPIVHAEIRSSDPDATREFFANLFGWSYSDGAYPGYTFVAAGAEGGPPTAISPLQADADQVLFFVGGHRCRRDARSGREARRNDRAANPGSARGHVRRARRSARPSDRRRRPVLALAARRVPGATHRADG